LRNEKEVVKMQSGMVYSIIIAVLMICVMNMPAAAQLADTHWHMFHHDLNHTGLSQYHGPDTPAIKWNFSTGNRITGSAVIGEDGTIYVGTRNYQKPKTGSKLYAIYPNGTKNWHWTASHFIDSTPAVASDGTIYMGSWGKCLYAIYPNGTKRWEFCTHCGGFVLTSPAIAPDDTIYVGSNDKKLYAIYPNGTKKWIYSTGCSIQSSPAIDADGTIYVGSKDGYVYAINPNGTLMWKYYTGTTILYSSPAISSDDTVYIGNGGGNLYAFGPGTQLPGTSNIPPTLDAIGDKTINETETVMIDLNASDQDGDSLTYSCNRTNLFTDFDSSTGTGNWTPDYDDSGTYRIDFSVSDGWTDIFVSHSYIDNLNGVVSFAAARQETTDGVTRNGTFAIVHFTAIKQNATSELVLNNVLASDNSTPVVTYELEPVNGSIEVCDNLPPVVIARSLFIYNNIAKRGLSKAYFNGTESYDLDGTITHWNWWVDDGSSLVGETTEHLFEVPMYWQGVSDGHYVPANVALTVTDDGMPLLDNSTTMEAIVWIAGDATDDGRVNIADTVTFGMQFGNHASINSDGLRWYDNPEGDKADLNNDGWVNIGDAMLLGTPWGPTAW
jgi:outer membrane protein assembly factor BamB